MTRYKGAILILGNTVCWTSRMTQVLKAEGYKVTSTTKPNEGIALCRKEKYDIILLDYALNSKKSHDILSKILIIDPSNKVIVTAIQPNVKDAVKFLSLGAFDYIEDGRNYENVKAVVDSQLTLKLHSAG